jgi:hypothetical protein
MPIFTPHASFLAFISVTLFHLFYPFTINFPFFPFSSFFFLFLPFPSCLALLDPVGVEIGSVYPGFAVIVVKGL